MQYTFWYNTYCKIHGYDNCSTSEECNKRFETDKEQIRQYIQKQNIEVRWNLKDIPKIGYASTLPRFFPWPQYNMFILCVLCNKRHYIQNNTTSINCFCFKTPYTDKITYFVDKNSPIQNGIAVTRPHIKLHRQLIPLYSLIDPIF
jgi:hypothetical protein